MHFIGVKNPYKCRYPDCNEELRTRRLFDAHIRTTHRSDDPKTWRCKVCPTDFPTRLLFDQHMRSSHPDAEQAGNWTCRFCHEKFRTLDLRTHHVQTVHPGLRKSRKDPNNEDSSQANEMSLICEKCGKVFTSRHSFNGEIRFI